jgi:4'-phosphopantetheinyl transferase
MKDNEMYVWNIDWRNYIEKKPIFYSLLTLEEKSRAEHYKLDITQNQFIMTRAILRLLISDLINQNPEIIQFEYTDLGKPKLIGTSSLYFNVSHSQYRSLYAFCKYPDIGVDIEYQKDLDFKSIAKRYFSLQENQILNTLMTEEEKKQAFFKGWVQKESIVKAQGLGLTLPLNQIEVELGTNFPGIVKLPSILHNMLKWHLHEIKINKNFKAVVVVRAPCASMHLNIFHKLYGL